MEYNVTIGNSNYVVESAEENLEASALITKAMELFYEKEMEFQRVEEEYKRARYQIERMFKKGNEEFGLKKVNGDYIKVTYVPASDGKTTLVKKFDEVKALAIFNELGITEDEYMSVVEKTTGKRKESIRVGTE